MQSIRQQEKIYENQILDTYAHCPQLFITHSSDLLYLQLLTEKTFTHIVAKCTFAPQQILLQIRGSIISKSTFQKIKKEFNSIPLLLNLNKEYYITPKNISKYLFQPTHQKSNCYIQLHYNCKLLVYSSCIIGEGEKLTLDKNSLALIV